MDPSRHVHPGIPYDFYTGYVVVEAQNLDGQNQNNRQEKTVVLGQLPQVVRAKLEQEWGKYQYINDNKVLFTAMVFLLTFDLLSLLKVYRNILITIFALIDYHENECR